MVKPGGPNHPRSWLICSVPLNFESPSLVLATMTFSFVGVHGVYKDSKLLVFIINF